MNAQVQPQCTGILTPPRKAWSRCYLVSDDRQIWATADNIPEAAAKAKILGAYGKCEVFLVASDTHKVSARIEGLILCYNGGSITRLGDFNINELIEC